MQLIHYCGFAFAIIFAICNHSAQKAERILHVCQKVLEFLKSAKIPFSNLYLFPEQMCHMKCVFKKVSLNYFFTIKLVV